MNDVLITRNLDLKQFIIEFFINEVFKRGQYFSQKEFEYALKIIKSIFELINSLKKENINQNSYYTQVLWNYNVTKDAIFKESFNRIKQKDFKVAIRNIIFNKVNPKDWQKERVHSEENHFDYLDGEDYKDEANISLAEATERQLINLDSKYLLINFIDSCFQCQHQEIIECNSICTLRSV